MTVVGNGSDHEVVGFVADTCEALVHEDRTGGHG